MQCNKVWRSQNHVEDFSASRHLHASADASIGAKGAVSQQQRMDSFAIDV